MERTLLTGVVIIPQPEQFIFRDLLRVLCCVNVAGRNLTLFRNMTYWETGPTVSTIETILTFLHSQPSN